MEDQVFKIDENQFDSLKRKFFIRNLKLLGFPFLFISIVLFLQTRSDDRLQTEFTLFFALIVLLIPYYIGTNKLIKAYKTLEIILNKHGVEAKAEMMPYKSISWENLIIEEKSNGTIDLCDKSVSVFMRKMYGRGWIIVQPETLNKHALLNEL